MNDSRFLFEMDLGQSYGREAIESELGGPQKCNPDASAAVEEDAMGVPLLTSKPSGMGYVSYRRLQYWKKRGSIQGCLLCIFSMLR